MCNRTFNCVIAFGFLGFFGIFSVLYPVKSIAGNNDKLVIKQHQHQRTSKFSNFFSAPSRVVIRPNLIVNGHLNQHYYDDYNRGNSRRQYRNDDYDRGNSRRQYRNDDYDRGVARRNYRRGSHRRAAERRHRWSLGTRYYDQGYGQSYIVNDYGRYDLRRPPRGHVWRRDELGNFILIAAATGVITQLILDAGN